MAVSFAVCKSRNNMHVWASKISYLLQQQPIVVPIDKICFPMSYCLPLSFCFLLWCSLLLILLRCKKLMAVPPPDLAPSSPDPRQIF